MVKPPSDLVANINIWVSTKNYLGNKRKGFGGPDEVKRRRGRFFDSCLDGSP